MFKNGSVLEGPDLPEKIADHCTVAVGDQTVLVKRRHGLSKARRSHACSKPLGKTWKTIIAIRLSYRYVVGAVVKVAKIKNPILIQSVELVILDPDFFSTMKWKWQEGTDDIK